MTDDIKNMRRLVEMAYLYALGPHGTPDIRDQFRAAFPSELGSLQYRDGGFEWSSNPPTNLVSENTTR